MQGEMHLLSGRVKEAIETWQSVHQQQQDEEGAGAGAGGAGQSEQWHETSPGILRELGVMHRLEGSGIEDAEKAIDLYEKAALKGSVLALHSMGVLYKFGSPKIQKDLSKAKFFYELAAERGSAAACSALGQFYHNGLGSTEVNLLLAKTYYSMALSLSAKDAH